MKRESTRIAGAGLIAVLLAGCGASAGDGAGNDGDPIRIALMQGVTGPLAGLAADYGLGVKTAVDEINANGGVAGRRLDVNSVDTRSDPTHALSALNGELESGTPPDLVILSGSSAETLASLPALTDAEMFSIGPPSAPPINDPAAYPYHFGVTLPQNETLQTIIDSFTSHDVKTLGVLVGADALGDAQLSGVKQATTAAGVKIVADERPDMTSLNFTVELQRLAGAKPDAIFADSHSGDALSRLFEARETVGALDIPLIVGPGAGFVGPVRISKPPALDNCEMPVSSYTVAPVADYLEPLSEAIVADGTGRAAGTVGSGYDTIRILSLALERTEGDTSAETLTEAMLDLDMPADYSALYPTGTTYTEENHFPANRDGALQMIPCAAELKDGFWVID